MQRELQMLQQSFALRLEGNATLKAPQKVTPHADARVMTELERRFVVPTCLLSASRLVMNDIPWPYLSDARDNNFRSLCRVSRRKSASRETLLSYFKSPVAQSQEALVRPRLRHLHRWLMPGRRAYRWQAVQPGQLRIAMSRASACRPSQTRCADCASVRSQCPSRPLRPCAHLGWCAVCALIEQAEYAGP